MAKVLLTHHATRCHEYDQKVQPMPAILEHAVTADRTIDPNHCTMVLRSIGNGHTQSIPLNFGATKFLFMVMDYFIKWVKVKPPTKIIEARVKYFIWKYIICRFSLPRVIYH